ncbi:hypothetical protein BVRB_2g032770 isoform B [Beta vulgaris subsp. vulgaris]|nr:hypothetical protein BVRB_2g032770 isoform B [Beta vulgaris subsp. vulgaris]
MIDESRERFICKDESKVSYQVDIRLYKFKQGPHKQSVADEVWQL